MTDIIQNAKRLLEGVTPGPWKFEESTGYEYPAGPEWGSMMTELEHSVQDKDGYHLFGAYNDYRMIEAPGNLPLAAAAPVLAQALAEETWEYQVQARSMKRPAWKPSTNDILQKWYSAEDIEEAKDKARMYTPYFRGRENVEIRVLRRRVSPPEVINE